MTEYSATFVGDSNENCIRVLITEGMDILFTDSIGEASKIFKINDDVAIHIEYIPGLGWMAGLSFLKTEDLISDTYKFRIHQSFESPESPELVVTSSRPIKIDGVYGDDKSAVKSILTKYGMAMDETKIQALVNDFKKLLA
jgi:hypothetical protein